MRPKFSIITVCKNSQSTIHRTVSSIVNQSFQDYEHILIDGLSTDNTVEIVESIIPIEKRTILSECDNGIYDAMNKGLQLANGEFLFFLNSDDYLASNEVLSYINDLACKNTDLILSGISFIDKNNVVRRTWHVRSYYRNKVLNFLPHSGFIVRTSIAKEVNYSLDYKLSSDFDWMLKLQSRIISEKVVVSEIIMTKMLLGGASTNSIGSVFNGYKEINSILKNHGFTYRLPYFIWRYTKKLIQKL